MDEATNEKISLLDEVKLQARVLVPVLRALRQEIGAERANAIVYGALREWSRNLFLEIGKKMPGRPREKWAAMLNSVMPRIGDDVDFDVKRQDAEAFDFNVTGCRYADFFRQLGEPELGTILLCETDLHQVEVGSPDVELDRTQTIMKGAKFCDFRFRMKKAADAG